MAGQSTGATKTLVKTSGESVLFGFDFGPLLNDGETLSGIEVSASSPSGITIGTPSVKATSWTDKYTGETIAANKGGQSRISGGTDGVDYTFTATVTTSDGNTRELPCTLQVRDS